MSTEILSNALVELGEDRIVSSTQDTERARVVQQVYEVERDALLEEHPWNFALDRTELARCEADPVWGFSSAFMLPVDCLAVVETIPVVPYKVEGEKILTNTQVLAIRYIQRVESSRQMPATFKVALAARIAARVAKRITGSSAEKERMEQLYTQRLRIAKSRDAQSGGQADCIAPDSFLRARGRA